MSPPYSCCTGAAAFGDSGANQPAEPQEARLSTQRHAPGGMGGGYGIQVGLGLEIWGRGLGSWWDEVAALASGGMWQVATGVRFICCFFFVLAVWQAGSIWQVAQVVNEDLGLGLSGVQAKQSGLSSGRLAAGGTRGACKHGFGG